jgi:lipopolysaccharide export system protein LptA
MTYAITPSQTSVPVSQQSLNVPQTQVINFTGNVIVTRGIGEKSNVITIQKAS